MFSKMINKFVIDGLDRLGKSSLIQNIRNELGYFEVVHYLKPERLSFYDGHSTVEGEFNKLQSFYRYQYDSFTNLMKMLCSEAKFIFDRSHLGEDVYAPLYRNYSGDYVFELEKQFAVSHLNDVRLILLVEDFEKSSHFVDDGFSLGSIEKRQEEQIRFVSAFGRSIIKDKRIICVTDNTGKFKTKSAILAEALQ